MIIPRKRGKNMLKKVTVPQAASLLGRGNRYIQMGLQQRVLPFGTCVTTSNPKIHSYHISPGLLAHYMHITVDELEQRIQNEC